MFFLISLCLFFKFHFRNSSALTQLNDCNGIVLVDGTTKCSAELDDEGAKGGTIVKGPIITLTGDRIECLLTDGFDGQFKLSCKYSSGPVTFIFDGSAEVGMVICGGEIQQWERCPRIQPIGGSEIRTQANTGLLVYAFKTFF